MPSPIPPQTYAQRLLDDLEQIQQAYEEILVASAIRNVDPNRAGRTRGFIVAGGARWGWVPSEPPLEAARMRLLAQVRGWGPRFRLLFPHPTPTVQATLDAGLGLLERWLVRPGRDKTVPDSLTRAAAKVADAVDRLRALAHLVPVDEHRVRLVVDTNTLIDNPDLAAHTTTLGPRYLVHLLPVVLGELDDLKRAGRTPELREAARRADRRLKGLRNTGDVLAGVRVAGEVHAVFEHAEPRGEHLPSWLDLAVPDDRLVAAALLLQAAHPGSALYVATSDLNLQTKLAAAGLPTVEPES